MDEEKKEADSSEISFENQSELSGKKISHEEVSIEDLHEDLEKRLEEQGFMFDKRKFIFHDKHLTFGQRLADSVARFGGSWKFIIIFGIFIFVWISMNIYFLLNRGFDPYPFILLNLILSCLASMQAPIIMMSQNRQALKAKKQEEINLEKDIVDFKQDRLDLILDQKEWVLLKELNERMKRIEEELAKKKNESASLKTKLVSKKKKR